MEWSARQKLHEEFKEIIGEPEITIDLAKRAVAIIQLFADDDDDEVAHLKEDGLRHEILKTIAQGTAYSQALAAIALETSLIKFARWCA